MRTNSKEELESVARNFEQTSDAARLRMIIAMNPDGSFKNAVMFDAEILHTDEQTGIVTEVHTIIVSQAVMEALEALGEAPAISEIIVSRSSEPPPGCVALTCFGEPELCLQRVVRGSRADLDKLAALVNADLTKVAEARVKSPQASPAARLSEQSTGVK
jgi:hypothetical protein